MLDINNTQLLHTESTDRATNILEMIEVEKGMKQNYNDRNAQI